MANWRLTAFRARNQRNIWMAISGRQRTPYDDRRPCTHCQCLEWWTNKTRIDTKISWTTYSGEVHDDTQFMFHARQSLCKMYDEIFARRLSTRRGEWALEFVFMWLCVHRSAVHRAKPILWQNESRQRRSLFCVFIWDFQCCCPTSSWRKKNRKMFRRTA